MEKPFVLLTLLILLTQGAGLYAQNVANMALLESTTPVERADIQTALLADKLALTDSQANDLAKINLNYAEQMDDVIKGGASKWKMYRTAKRFGKAKDEELKALFSLDQFSTYLSYKEQLKTDGKEKLLQLQKEKPKVE